MSSDPLTYAIVIEQAGANYSAYAPNLPGVITTGATPEETEQRMREAIRFHLRELVRRVKPSPRPEPAPPTFGLPNRRSRRQLRHVSKELHGVPAALV